MRHLARRSLFAAFTFGLLAACSQAGAAGGGDKGKMTASEIGIGSPNAKATVIEYASVTCSHCAKFNQDIYPEFKKKYVDTGRVRYIFREFLTPPEQISAAGFLLARCAGSAKYLNVVDSLFRTQGTLFQTQDARGWLFNTAKSVGLSDAQAKACIEDETALKALNDRVQNAIEKEKINSTPTLIFTAKGKPPQTNSGEMTMAQIDAILQPMLAGK